MCLSVCVCQGADCWAESGVFRCEMCVCVCVCESLQDDMRGCDLCVHMCACVCVCVCVCVFWVM